MIISVTQSQNTQCLQSKCFPRHFSHCWDITNECSMKITAFTQLPERILLAIKFGMFGTLGSYLKDPSKFP